MSEHGTRSRYVNDGCRCFQCRLAQANYQHRRKVKIRAGEWTPRPSADRVREHLFELSRHGIGKTTISMITGVSIGQILDFKKGRRKFISAKNERLILAVTTGARTEHTRVPAWRTRRMIKHLMIEGFTRKELCKRLGKGQFQIARRKTVFAKTEMDVEKLYNRIMAEAA